MEIFRSKSCRDGMNHNLDHNHNQLCFNGGMMMRSYSANYAHQNPMGRDKKMKKSKGSFGISQPKKGWRRLCDPELQRKKRVAAYKMYAVEGKVKGSIGKSFRWIRETCSNAVYGWW